MKRVFVLNIATVISVLLLITSVGTKKVFCTLRRYGWSGCKSSAKSSKYGPKLEVVSEHINTVLRYIPFVQTNFVLGLDSDAGEESFGLTKRFDDMSPAAFPAYPLLTSLGRAAPLNLDYQDKNRVLPLPFHFLNNNHAMNVKPETVTWPEFYDRTISLIEYSFS
jgi:hypothetical protein